MFDGDVKWDMVSLGPRPKPTPARIAFSIILQAIHVLDERSGNETRICSSGYKGAVTYASPVEAFATGIISFVYKSLGTFLAYFIYVPYFLVRTFIEYICHHIKFYLDVRVRARNT